MASKSTTQKSTPRELEARVDTTRQYHIQTVHNTVLSWRVPDFETLSCGVVYFQTYEMADQHQCGLRVLKTEDRLSLTVTSPRISPNTLAQFMILDEKQRLTLTRQAQKLRSGVYTALFDNSEFLYPESGYLRRGVLTVAFKYASDAYVRFRQLRSNERETLTDLDDLCCDLKRMYLEAIHPDFEVHVGEYVFSTHRFILASRSTYFESILLNDQSLTQHSLEGDNFHPGVVHEVFLYMYCAELKDLPVECMLWVYWTAVFFKMDTLCARCLSYFQTRISLGNYMDIVKFVVKYNLVELKNDLMRLPPSKLPGVTLLKVIMQELILESKSAQLAT